MQGSQTNDFLISPENRNLDPFSVQYDVGHPVCISLDSLYARDLGGGTSVEMKSPKED